MSGNSIIAMIPARYAATRFPGKLMQLLGNKTVILHTYDNTVATGLFDDVIVVTDSDIIYNEIISHGGKAMMSKRVHNSGSDRIAEAIENMDVDVIVNVQGDEPFQQKEPLQKLLALFNDQSVQVASMMRKISAEEIKDPNSVKVVVDNQNYADDFARRIPYEANPGLTGYSFLSHKIQTATYFLHIGVYAYRKEALLAFTKCNPSDLEQSKKLEQLRFRELGYKIKMVETDYNNIAIDTPEDLERAIHILSR